MGLNLGIFHCFCIGFLLLVQPCFCDVPLSSSVGTTQDETTDSTVISILSKTFSPENISHNESSMTSTTTMQTTQLYKVSTPQDDNQFKSLCFEKEINVVNTIGHNYSVNSINGDIMVTFILHPSDIEIEIIREICIHVNGIDLLVHNVTIGVRIIKILKPLSPDTLLDLLESEIDFSEHCMENPFGIFLSNELWKYELLRRKKLEFKIWPLPVIETIQMRRVVHALKELMLPISLQNASLEFRTDSSILTERFKSALKMENLCLNDHASHDEKIYVYIGRADFLNTALFKHNASLIVVPLSLKDFVLANIPNQAIVAIEPQILFNEVSSSSSEFASIATLFYEISNSINEAILKKCSNTFRGNKLELKNCEIFHDYYISEEVSTTNIKKVLQSLKFQYLENKMSYDLFEKWTSVNSSLSVELKEISTTNFVTNVTASYKPDRQERFSFEAIMRCKEISSHSSQNGTHGEKKHVDSFELDGIFPPEVKKFELDIKQYDDEIYNWKIRTELWVAIGLTVSTLGVLFSLAMITFIIVRLCLEDVLEGNPLGSIAILFALIIQFASFFPFILEPMDLKNAKSVELSNFMCTIRIFAVSVPYCFTFSLILSRAVMLASIGSEGGFLSHVNGYIQSIICVFSFLVQLGLSTQLLIILNAHQRQNFTCEDIFYGNWLWGTLGYDAFLLILLLLLTPFIFRSQRNYREGILIAITSFLCVVCWTFWIPISMISSKMREMVIPLGCQATGWIILSSLMVPRCFFIVKSIARSDFTQALPSLTSLAFAQGNNFISEPSIYECVNPSMQSLSNIIDETNNDDYLSTSEVPTLPLRGGGRSNLNYNEITPNKITRF